MYSDYCEVVREGFSWVGTPHVLCFYSLTSCSEYTHIMCTCNSFRTLHSLCNAPSDEMKCVIFLSKYSFQKPSSDIRSTGGLALQKIPYYSDSDSDPTNSIHRYYYLHVQVQNSLLHIHVDICCVRS